MANQDKIRKLALPLSFTSLLTIVFLAVAAMSGAYVWGVMSGRASVQQTKMTAPEPKQAVVAPEPDPAILKARELEFAHALKGETPPQMPVEQPKIETPPPQPAGATADSNPETPAAPETPKTPPPETSPAVAPGQLFDYTFQMAALRDEQAVDNLRERLEGRGMRTRMERSGKHYLVLVLLRGDDARAAEVMQAARELRLGEPLLRSKKPADR